MKRGKGNHFEALGSRQHKEKGRHPPSDWQVFVMDICKDWVVAVFLHV